MLQINVVKDMVRSILVTLEAERIDTKAVLKKQKEIKEELRLIRNLIKK